MKVEDIEENEKEEDQYKKETKINQSSRKGEKEKHNQSKDKAKK